MFGWKRRRSRIRRLEEALQWYADESHWRRKSTNPKGSPRRWAKSAAARDRGGRARIALAGGWSQALWRAARRAFGGKDGPFAPTVPAPLVSASVTGLVNTAARVDPLPLIPDPATSSRADDTE